MSNFFFLRLPYRRKRQSSTTNKILIELAIFTYDRVCKRDIQCRVSILLMELKRLLKLYLSSEFHKFVRGRFSAEPEDKKQKIVSNMYLVSYETFTCLCSFISYFKAVINSVELYLNHGSLG